MAFPRSIKTESQYKTAIKNLERLIRKNPKAGTLESDILLIQSMFISKYEERMYTFKLPSARNWVRFVMEGRGLKQKDLLSCFGNPASLSLFLSGKGGLNINNVRKLHKKFGIPVHVLVTR